MRPAARSRLRALVIPIFLLLLTGSPAPAAARVVACKPQLHIVTPQQYAHLVIPETTKFLALDILYNVTHPGCTPLAEDAPRANGLWRVEVKEHHSVDPGRLLLGFGEPIYLVLTEPGSYVFSLRLLQAAPTALRPAELPGTNTAVEYTTVASEVILSFDVVTGGQPKIDPAIAAAFDAGVTAYDLYGQPRRLDGWRPQRSHESAPAGARSELSSHPHQPLDSWSRIPAPWRPLVRPLDAVLIGSLSSTFDGTKQFLVQHESAADRRLLRFTHLDMFSSPQRGMDSLMAHMLREAAVPIVFHQITLPLDEWTGARDFLEAGAAMGRLSSWCQLSPRLRSTLSPLSQVLPRYDVLWRVNQEPNEEYLSQLPRLVSPSMVRVNDLVGRVDLPCRFGRGTQGMAALAEAAAGTAGPAPDSGDASGGAGDRPELLVAAAAPPRAQQGEGGPGAGGDGSSALPRLRRVLPASEVASTCVEEAAAARASSTAIDVQALPALSESCSYTAHDFQRDTEAPLLARGHPASRNEDTGLPSLLLLPSLLPAPPAEPASRAGAGSPFATIAGAGLMAPASAASGSSASLHAAPGRPAAPVASELSVLAPAGRRTGDNRGGGGARLGYSPGAVLALQRHMRSLDAPHDEAARRAQIAEAAARIAADGASLPPREGALPGASADPAASTRGREREGGSAKGSAAHPFTLWQPPSYEAVISPSHFVAQLDGVRRFAAASQVVSGLNSRRVQPLPRAALAASPPRAACSRLWGGLGHRDEASESPFSLSVPHADAILAGDPPPEPRSEVSSRGGVAGRARPPLTHVPAIEAAGISGLDSGSSQQANAGRSVRGLEAEPASSPQRQPDPPLVVAFIGRIAREKGVGIFIKAVAALVREHRCTHLPGAAPAAAAAMSPNASATEAALPQPCILLPADSGERLEVLQPPQQQQGQPPGPAAAPPVHRFSDASILAEAMRAPWLRHFSFPSPAQGPQTPASAATTADDSAGTTAPVLLPGWRRRPLRFVVIGGAAEPAYEAGMRRMAAELGVGPFLDWVGFVHPSALMAWYRHRCVDLLVAPYLRPLSESFGLVLTEAMEAQVPVVHFAVGGIQDYARPVGGGRPAGGGRSAAGSGNSFVPAAISGPALGATLLHALGSDALRAAVADAAAAFVRAKLHRDAVAPPLEASLRREHVASALLYGHVPGGYRDAAQGMDSCPGAAANGSSGLPILFPAITWRDLKAYASTVDPADSEATPACAPVLLPLSPSSLVEPQLQATIAASRAAGHEPSDSSFVQLNVTLTLALRLLPESARLLPAERQPVQDSSRSFVAATHTAATERTSPQAGGDGSTAAAAELLASSPGLQLAQRLVAGFPDVLCNPLPPAPGSDGSAAGQQSDSCSAGAVQRAAAALVRDRLLRTGRLCWQLHYQGSAANDARILSRPRSPAIHPAASFSSSDCHYAMDLGPTAVTAVSAAGVNASAEQLAATDTMPVVQLVFALRVPTPRSFGTASASGQLLLSLTDFRLPFPVLAAVQCKL